MKSRLGLAIVWVLATLTLATTRGGAAQVTIYRDRFGVPSVAADRLSDTMYGLGYAMALDDAEQMARNYKQARGRMAEVEGRSQLLQDGFLRSLGIEDLAQQRAKSLTGEQAELLNSFCAGANRALEEQKGQLPAWIEPFTPTDVLALTQATNAAFALLDISHQLLPAAGSNQFVVAPKRTSNGHAILSADPHLSWSGLFCWYAYALYTPQFSFRGVALAGLPFGIMGHTDRVAWSMTNNDPTLFSFYQVQTDPNHPKQYNDHGEWRDFEEVPIDLRYRDGDQLKSVHQTIRRTVWGPMLPFRSQAVRLSMLGSWDLIDEALRMERARNAQEFRAALQMQGTSMWNYVYADTEGHIGYQYNARVPHLDPALDWTKPVPGSDPRSKWGDLWTADQLPHIEDPQSNLLVNANSAPWLTPTDSELPTNQWPAYVTSYGHTTRYDRLTELLTHDNHISPGRAQRYATDTRVPFALETVAAVRRVLEPAGSDPVVKEALRVLSRWNGRADVDSRGCALYLYWYRADKKMPELARKANRGEVWSTEEAKLASGALKRGATDLKKDRGRLDVRWGEVHFTQRGTLTTGLSGFGYVVKGDDAAAVVPNGGGGDTGPIQCSFGSSFRMIVDLDPKGVRSWSILPYGESQNPHSPHYADQLPLFGRGAYADTLFGLARIRKAAASTLVLTAP